MSFRCSHESCFPDTTCALGHLDRTSCEHWKGAEPAQGGEDEAVATETSDIPWNGYVLGTSDLAILGGRGRPAVVGLIGPPDSGKTSLLAFLYMWLLKHGRIGEWMFAGSWTLGGWESVVQHSRWTGEPPPSFPPHTSSAGRHPGILHLALRCAESGQLRDVMFTDAPGEWFTHWSRVPGDVTSAGARWVVQHSDALLLLIDSGALADSAKLPVTRRATRDLIERVAAHAMSPVAVVWTKDDIDVPEPATRALESTCMGFLPQATVLRTTVKEAETIEACFDRALAAATSKARLLPAKEPRFSDDPFLAFRGIHVGA
jgi:Double-GTPase 2